MSTLKTNNVQVGQSVTATNNFTLYQPATPDGTVRLGVGNSGATTSDVITANSSSNVGIGTSSPAYRLDVQGGNIRVLREATQGGLQLFTYSSTQTYNAPRIETWRGRGTAASPTVVAAGDELFSLQCSGWNASAGWTYTGGIYMYATGTVTGSNVPSYMSFETNSGSSGTERMRIDASGNLLVGGTTSPTGSGSIYANNRVFVGTTNTDPTFNRVNGINLLANGALLTRASAGWDMGLSTTSATHITFYTDNGSARVTAGNIASNGNVTSYNTGSDYRLKEDVAPMAGVLSKIAALKPVTYKWIGNKAQGEGFLAHELAEIIPLAVTGEKDAIKEDGSPDIQSVDYSKIVVHLVAAIQEQQALITSLTARIAALEAK